MFISMDSVIQELQQCKRKISTIQKKIDWRILTNDNIISQIQEIQHLSTFLLDRINDLDKGIYDQRKNSPIITQSAAEAKICQRLQEDKDNMNKFVQTVLPAIMYALQENQNHHS